MPSLLVTLLLLLEGALAGFLATIIAIAIYEHRRHGDCWACRPRKEPT